MSRADAVAAVLWVGVTAYAVFGGADFGGGFWSLCAGRGERGTSARELIDWTLQKSGWGTLDNLEARRWIDCSSSSSSNGITTPQASQTM